MFADACRSASQFTRPVVTSTRTIGGEVRTAIGTFIVLNRGGWFLTAGHMFDPLVLFQRDMRKAEEVRSTGGEPDPAMLSNHSMWWGWDGVRATEIAVNRQLDIAVGRLEPFDPEWVGEYPVFADPADVRVGRSLCRGGFAFARFVAKWDDSRKAFEIPKIPQEALFFNDCMMCREEMRGRTNDGGYEMRYIETSTPGIKGQSGGPIFDRDGRIHAMQIRTDSIDLGFQPTARMDGRTVVENQFINIGAGLHASSIRRFLDDRRVRYDAEGDETGFRIIG